MRLWYIAMGISAALTYFGTSYFLPWL